MKIFHTSDWHLGKFVNGFSMLEDQKYILNELILSLKKNQIDTLIISGDIFDRAIAPQEAVKLLDETIYKIISELKIKILIIPGNHDSAQRLSFASKLYSDSGLHIIGDFNKTIPKVTLHDQLGPVNFYLLPYFNVNQISKMFEDEEDISIKTFNDAFKTIINYNKPLIDISSRNILVAHGFFGYLNPDNNVFYDQIVSPSEVSVGGVDIMDLSPASFFDYIALGHLHAPQKIKNPSFRYAGSLLKYSVEESNQTKSNVVLEIHEKENLTLTFEQLKPLRDIRIVSGFMSEFCDDNNFEKLVSDDYVFVKLLDEDVVFDAVPRLRQVFKNIIGVKMVNRFTKTNDINLDKVKDKDLSTLFDEFYFAVSGNHLNLQKKEILSKVLSSIEDV